MITTFLFYDSDRHYFREKDFPISFHKNCTPKEGHDYFP